MGWTRKKFIICMCKAVEEKTNKLKEQNQFPITASCERNVILTVWGKFKSLYTYSHIMLKWFRVKALDTWNKQEKLSLFWKTVNMVFGLSSFPLWECGVRGCTQLSQDYMPRKSVLSIQIYLLPKTLIFAGHHFSVPWGLENANIMKKYIKAAQRQLSQQWCGQSPSNCEDL